MSSEHYYAGSTSISSAALRLQSYHQRRFSPLLLALSLALLGFVLWAATFRIDEVARAGGEVIASSRVQLVQAVDGGVLAALHVEEGDPVSSGQILAELDKSRIAAAVGEIEARLSALKIRATRLRAEVTGADVLHFPDELLVYLDLVDVERALFRQRRTGLRAEIGTLQTAVSLAREEVDLVKQLAKSGDVNRLEELRAAKALNDAESRLVNRRNQFLEESNAELTKVEDQIAQNEQVLMQRHQQLTDATIIAPLTGIIKNIRVTTVGGVLHAGEELLEIVPTEDKLILEAKVSPADIARVQQGLVATVRFDPFDYTIWGSVEAEVVYVSADTLKEQTNRGEEIFYRVRLAPKSSPVTTTTGKELNILPGMTAQVDIRTGDRTLLNFLLKPLRKTLAESLGER